MITYNEEIEERMGKLFDPNISRDEVMELYGRWAESYDQDIEKHSEAYGPVHVADKVLQLLGDHKDARIIDVGAGTGLVGKELRKHGFENLDALDASQEMLDIAKAKGLYNTTICAYLGPDRLQILEGVYDAVTLSGVFVPKHANDTCFEEIIRILKPGGYFVFAISSTCLQLPDFKDFEARIQTLQENGLWNCVMSENIIYGARDIKALAAEREGKLFTLQKSNNN